MRPCVLLLLVLLALAASLPPAQAFEAYAGERRGWRYDWNRQEYVALVVVEPVPVFVAVPTPATLLVNVAPPAYLPTVTVSAAAYQAEQAKVQALRQADSATLRELKALRAEVRALRENRAPPPAGPGKDLPPAVPGFEPRQREARPPDEPRGEPRQQAAARPPLAVVAGIFRARCGDCHSGTRARGGVSLFDAAGEFELKGADPQDVLAAVSEPDETRRMPLRRPALSEEELEILRAWSR